MAFIKSLPVDWDLRPLRGAGMHFSLSLSAEATFPKGKLCYNGPRWHGGQIDDQNNDSARGSEGGEELRGAASSRYGPAALVLPRCLLTNLLHPPPSHPGSQWGPTVTAIGLGL